MTCQIPINYHLHRPRFPWHCARYILDYYYYIIMMEYNRAVYYYCSYLRHASRVISSMNNLCIFESSFLYFLQKHGQTIWSIMLQHTSWEYRLSQLGNVTKCYQLTVQTRGQCKQAPAHILFSPRLCPVTSSIHHMPLHTALQHLDR